MPVASLRHGFEPPSDRFPQPTRDHLRIAEALMYCAALCSKSSACQTARAVASRTSPTPVSTLVIITSVTVTVTVTFTGDEPRHDLAYYGLPASIGQVTDTTTTSSTRSHVRRDPPGAPRLTSQKKPLTCIKQISGFKRVYDYHWRFTAMFGHPYRSGTEVFRPRG
jgi:hypothetical protein